MVMRSKELKVYNLPVEEKQPFFIDSKPYLFIIFVVLFGIAFLFSTTTMPLGFLLTGVGLFCLLFFPRMIMIEFYDSYLILHNKADKTTCVLIYYEDIVSWYYKKGNYADYLYIELVDGTTERLEAFSKVSFEAAMNSYLKDKHKKK